MANTIILIPSRMSAQRLPGKPLLEVNGLPIICHVLKKARETQIGDVIVATEDQEIFDQVKKYKGDAILTSKKPKTGTDRIWEAFKKLNLKDVDYIINLQGDEPLIDIEDIKNLDNLTKKNNCEINTLATQFDNQKLIENKNIVKVQTENKLEIEKFSVAQNFSRLLKNQSQNIYHHIGIYEFSISSLEAFTNLDQSENEKKYKLEQLRAMDNNIKINVSYASSKVIGIDTKEDYIELKKIMEYKN
ncbi:3-deoxy-manno-octulosonate cytidylyltransferase [Pelagibacterales bacterium SAG-MED15]|nr:3-deoxy-manno-octulosonate cytidylyltransferase [Pelagibacterales bacterium SAG-MED15]